MKNTSFDNLRLGVFVLAGTAVLVATLYLVGNRRNLFSPVLRLTADFRDVSGLVAGNNVRLAGIDVGTVDKIEIRNDTTVRVTLLIRKEVRAFIRKTAVASIGTDGLMGNSLVRLGSAGSGGAVVEEGDQIGTAAPVAAGDMLQTLSRSNENLAVITEDLRTVLHAAANSPALNGLLASQTLAPDLARAASHLKTAGGQLQATTTHLNLLVSNVRDGKGNLGRLLRDSSMALSLHRSLLHVHSASRKADTLAAMLLRLGNQLQPGRSAAGTVLADTAFDSNLNQTMRHVKQGAARFNENMEALKHNVLFRGYYRKQARRRAKPR